MTDIIYARGMVRENTIWNAFSFNGPFSSIDEDERTILFGLYANTYLHGYHYLQIIESEDLQRLVDTYNVSVSRLTNEQAQFVLDVAAKRYVEKITDQIHTAKLQVREQNLSALDDEYDAKVEALDADYAAITRQRAEVQLAWDKAAQKIKELEMRTSLEEVAQDLVNVDIQEKELQAAKADLAVIEAGLKGLDIQLAITQTGIDITNTELRITESENEVDQIAIQVSETEVQESGIDLDITNSGIELQRRVADGEKLKVDSSNVAVRVGETLYETAKTEAEESQLEAQIVGIETDTAKLALIDNDLTLIQADNRIAQSENELFRKKKLLITSQEDNVTAETGFVETQQEVTETLDDKTLDYDMSDHDFKIAMSQKETEFNDNISTLKIDALDTKKDLADKIKLTKIEDATERTRIDDSRIEEAALYSDAAIDAAQNLADANITNTLTHTIGTP